MVCKACKCDPLVIKLRGKAKDAVERMAERGGVSVTTIVQRLIGNQVFIDEVRDNGGEILCRESRNADLKIWSHK